MQVLLLYSVMKKGERRSDCPISLSLEIFGDKWTLLILRDFIFFDNRHFNEFVTVEKISTNILTDRLKRLLDHGIVTKEVDPQNKSAFLYSLTPKGLELIPLVMEIYRWGTKHTEKNNADPELKNKVETDFNEVTQSIREELISSHRLTISPKK